MVLIMGNIGTPASLPGINITFKPVEKTNWVDFEAFFESRLSYCWCMAWRMTREELKHNTASDRKEFIKARIFSGVPVGLLGYLDDRPVCWCSVAPRETYQRLGGAESLKNVWSIACFYIQKEYRNKGFISLMIENAKIYAKDHGAEYLEAYPVDTDSPSYRFMGFVTTFQKMGFSFVHKEGTRRHVMVLKI
jgi:GNAT superfamily N-acetyltransferase